ncbi:unnamed protein product [Orchesella dallaii]|uniref:Ubiquitin-like domain-containing protein n=1 Tax=Orchesella dallaii TaxID=48710 RepID=A0ABP1PRF8_9HEXA
MLYIFQVDTGQMICFEMDVAISTVSSLKTKISLTQGIPIDKQVLLVSGGEILEQNSRVCNYAAGTDTNPIFLFNKLNIEGGGGIVTDHDSGNNVNVTDLETIQKQIDGTNTLPPTYMSVVTRAQLAQHVYEMGKEITRKCEVLIHHQHLQHQGWAAVVANLDDIVNVFNTKLNSFVNSYERFTSECTSEFVDSYVNGIDSTLKTLDTIKVPNGNVQKSIVSWLSEHYGSHDSVSQTPLHSHLQGLASSTRKTYDRLTQNNFLQSLQQETTSVIEKASSQNMKEIKGLEERLYGLDQLLQEANKLVLDQHELTQAFHQNASRASDLGDSSIFPDLSASHQHQLQVMYKNHTQLEDIRRRCSKAKEELTVNLNTRLKWIAFVQKNLSDQSGKICLYNESLKRMRVNVNVLQQIQSCERVFKIYSNEVNRRARTSRKLRNLTLRITEFNDLAERENEKRKQFINEHAGHFLSQLFDNIIEDNRVNKLPVPNLVEYHEYGESSEISETEEEEEPGQCANLRARIRELESSLSTATTHAREYETIANERQSAIDRQTSDYLKLTTEVEEMRSSLSIRETQLERLTKQVNDLKSLLDEFREKEEEQIEARNTEIAQHNANMDELKVSCEERVVELTRMFEFETAQKIKAVKDEQKNEFDALIKRFKLMNKSNAVGGSTEISSPKCKLDVESKREVFSDEEDAAADNSIIEDTRRGSLEHAVDAVAEISHDHKLLDATFTVHDYVVS